jgi:hypothetical protein
MDTPSSAKNETFLKVIAVTLSAVLSLSVATAALMVCMKLGYIKHGSPVWRLKNRIVQSFLVKPEYKELIKAAAPAGEEGFATTWDFDLSVALSRRIFEPTDMYGKKEYRMRPNTGVYNVRVWNGIGFQALVLPATPAVARLLRRNRTEDLVYFQTDANGFKPTDGGAPSGAPAVFFLGDSFTEGLWVNPGDTAASVVSRELKSAGMAARVYNLGVNGYDALECRWMLEHFAPALHPRVAVLNLFPNDVHNDYLKVIRGIGIPEENYRQMFLHLEEMYRFCRENDIELVVSAIPAKEEFQLPDALIFQDRVRSWCRTHGVTEIDPREDFRRIGPEKIYLSWDPHFSPAGHRFYARILLNGLIPVLKKVSH